MVETERLRIVPLNARMLRAYIYGNRKLESELNMLRPFRKMKYAVRCRAEYLILPRVSKSPGDHYLFHSFWLVIDKNTRLLVAELGFKGIPNKSGEVEIGYGTFFGFRRKGYMTEAVSGMIAWAGSRSDIRCILAEADEKNLASLRVLEKNGFRPIGQKGQMTWWRKELSTHSTGMPV
jgi:ribosomal-protein-alanine N-acetyltransferase